MQTASDYELILAWRENRSEDAFTALVERHCGLVFGVANRVTGSTPLAEEVVQEVFVLLARKAHTFHAGVIVPGWLHNTARNIALRTIRYHDRRIRREQDSIMMHSQPSSKSENERNWEAAEPYIDEAIADLPHRDREAVLLRFFCGKTFREIGLALNVTEDAARKRISRAVERIRHLIVQRGVSISAAACSAMFEVGRVQIVPIQTIQSTAHRAVRLTAFRNPVSGRQEFNAPLSSSNPFKVVVLGSAVILIFVAGLANRSTSIDHPPAESPKAELVAAFRARLAPSRANAGSNPMAEAQAPKPPYRILPFPSSTARIERLLDQIYLPSFQFDGLSHAEAILELSKLTKIGMPTPGLRKEAAIGFHRFAYPPDSDPSSDDAIYESLTITTPHVPSGLSLREALDIVAAGASEPIRFSVEGESICLMLSRPQTRGGLVIEVEPPVLNLPAFEELMMMPDPDAIALVKAQVREFFAAAGIPQDPHFSVGYAFRNKALFVSGTKEKVDLANRAVIEANQGNTWRTVGAEVTARLIEANPDSIREMDLFAGSTASMPMAVKEKQIKEWMRTAAMSEGISWMELHSELTPDRRSLDFWGPIHCGSDLYFRFTLRITPEPNPAGREFRITSQSVPIQNALGEMVATALTSISPLEEGVGVCENDEALVFEVNPLQEFGCSTSAIRRFIIISAKTIEPAPFLARQP